MLPPFAGSVRFCKIHVPKNFREARASEQWEYWEDAMVEEKNSLDCHDTMTAVPRTPGMKVIPVHWIYSAKVDCEGNVLRYKARLVDDGCRQIPGVDVDEVFAPTSSFGARRAILCKAAREDLEVHQLDIKTAFLNEELEEEVYVTQPPGFHNGDYGLVYRLNKALYGLKQAPRAWHKSLNASLRKFGIHPRQSDAGVYVSGNKSSSHIYLLTYVDDFLIVSKCLLQVQWVKTKLAENFTVHDLGEVTDFLGCEVRRDRVNRTIRVTCQRKIDELCEKFELDGNTRPVMSASSKSFVNSKHRQTEDGEGAGVPLC
jgi:Reverse transcriptase (RNA-dependent DNA polymerase)